MAEEGPPAATTTTTTVVKLPPNTSGKRTTAIKHQDAIPCPHDGPIFKAIITGTTRWSSEPSSNRLESNDPSSLHDALDLVRKFSPWFQVDKGQKKGVNLMDVAEEEKVPISPVQDLVHRVLPQLLLGGVVDQGGNNNNNNQPIRIKDQLQALQKVKTRLLQIMKSTRTAAEGEAEETTLSCQDDKNNKDYATLCALYRLLLEWSASFQSPFPLRRAIHAALVAICQFCSATYCVEMMNDGGQEEEQPFSSLQSRRLGKVDQAIFASVTTSPQERDNNNNGGLCDWHKPLHSLDVMLSYFQLLQTSSGDQPSKVNTEICIKALSFLKQKAVPLKVLDPSVTVSAVEDAILIANLYKTIPTEIAAAQDEAASLLWTQVFWNTLACPLVPTEALSSVTIAFGRAAAGMLALDGMDGVNDVQICSGKVVWWDLLFSEEESGGKENAPKQDDLGKNSWITLPDLPRALALQGLVANLEDATLKGSFRNASETRSTLLLVVFLRALARFEGEASDPEVRLAAIKGLGTLVSRCRNILQQQTVHDDRGTLAAMQTVATDLMEIVLSAWSNPPTRRLGNTIPVVFQNVVDFQEQLFLAQDPSSNGGLGETFLQDLVKRLLDQPPNRKGRYAALEFLIPRTGARSLLQDKNLLPDLLAGIGDGGHNMGAIADLTSKLLFHSLQEYKLDARESANFLTKETHETQAVTPPEWIQTWVPSLARELAAAELKRRKQIASYCLPRIIKIVGRGQWGKAKAWSSAEEEAMAQDSFAALIKHVNRSKLRTVIVEVTSPDRETASDRNLWALCEITRHAANAKLLDSPSTLKQAIGDVLPLDRFNDTLVHFCPAIRIVAFHSISAVVAACTSEKKSAVELCLAELILWKNALPFAIKTDSRDFLSSFFPCLVSFLDRLSIAESQEQGEPSHLMRDFVVDFLLKDIFVQKAAYPGTVNSNEVFALSLVECLVVFTCRDLEMAFDSKILPKTGGAFERRRNSFEELSFSSIRKALVGHEVVASLMSLLKSLWDGTRAAAFGMLSSLILLARRYNLSLPADYGVSIDIDPYASFLASSPRQREADTGARLIALACLSRAYFSDRLSYMKKLIAFLEQRVGLMRSKLESILSDNEDVSGGSVLPLAHGIIQSLRLLLESRALCGKTDILPEETLTTFARLLCRAMQVSLAVVADVKAGEFIDGMDGDIGQSSDCSGSSGSNSTRNKVNPGAIGANGTFSSLNRLDENEQLQRMASQRIVMGSWLLTKEACGTISVVLGSRGYYPTVEQVDEAGMILISTLTSLKHVGAAFAAHNALQRISSLCLATSALERLPERWTSRLLNEITISDKIRDSTLRRSTGYGLGFLSILRSDVAHRSTPATICRSASKTILRLSMPARDWMLGFLSAIGISEIVPGRLFTCVDESDDAAFIRDNAYQVRTRVHALNVLQTIILDAPLSKEVFPLVGDALISAIMGYVDPIWAVRNSATMLFASCMLRVVDADKNAVNSEATSKNAITATELFRAYAPLQSLLIAVLESSVKGRLEGWGDASLPPIVPILVLLYRLQPIMASGRSDVSYVRPFFPAVSLCLSHKQLSIRQGAARALANMSSRDQNSSASMNSLLDTAWRKIISSPEKASWNSFHGSLLTARELACRFSEARELIRKRGTDRLFRLIDVSSGSANYPPLCVAVVLEILETVLVENGDRTKLEYECFRLIAWISSGNPRQTDSAGLKDLAERASSIACKICTNLMFEPPYETARLPKLKLLLESPIADVRIVAAKSFKKLVYDEVERVQQHVDEARKSEILDSLQTLLLACIESECRRDNDPKDLVGTHPPTLRRFSRCLLEISSARNNIGDKEDGSMNRAFWGLGHLLVDKSDADLEMTPLVGNAAELLALSGPATSETSEDTGFLLDIISRIADPALPWRLRHSAAMALQHWSHLNNDGPRERDTSPGTVMPLLETTRVIRQKSVELLQDADPDVQYAALHVLMPLFGKPAVSPCVPKLALMRAVSTEAGCFFSVTSLTDFLLAKGKVLTWKMSTLTSEFEEAIGRGEDHRLNTGTGRQIFEEEDPNPELECGLWVQLVVAALLGTNNGPNQAAALQWDLGEKTCTLWDVCQEVLSRLLASQKEQSDSSMPTTHDLLAALSRAHGIFPHLHSFLLGCACISHFIESSGRDDKLAACQDLARTALSNPSQNDVHPCVGRVLILLAFSSKGGGLDNAAATITQLRDCCYLLSFGGPWFTNS